MRDAFAQAIDTFHPNNSLEASFIMAYAAPGFNPVPTCWLCEHYNETRPWRPNSGSCSTTKDQRLHPYGPECQFQAISPAALALEQERIKEGLVQPTYLSA